MSYSSLLFALRVGAFIATFLALALIGWAVSIDHHPGPTPRPAAQGSEPRPGEPSGYGAARRTEAPPADATAGGASPGTAADVTISGSLAWADPAFGPLYLALPDPRGTVATICGPADCVTRMSTDYGPDQRQHPERIADLSAHDFELVCGMSAAQRISLGRCPGTVTIASRPHAALPATDR